jgi:hypothetical protein
MSPRLPRRPNSAARLTPSQSWFTAPITDYRPSRPKIMCSATTSRKAPHASGYLRRAERAIGGSLTRPLHANGAARGMVLSHAGERLVERMVFLKNAALHVAVAA